MPTVYFTTPGLVSLTALTTFGVSVKSGDSPIGLFGTGAKYAIAWALRNSHRVTIYTGIERHEFGVQEETIRGGSFKIITLDGRPLGFTTELGPHWKAWQALRELASNTLDEDGTWGEGEAVLSSDTTTIVVKGEEFHSTFFDLDTIFCRGRKILYENADLRIREGNSSFLYYRGVRVMTLPECQFTYDFKKGLDLTEDRTVSGEYWTQMHLAACVAAITDEGLFKQIALSWMGEKNWDYAHAPETQELIERLGPLAEYSELNQSLKNKWVSSEKRKTHPVEPTALQLAMIAKAKGFVEELLGKPIAFPIKVYVLPSQFQGMARNGTIMLGQGVFTLGMREVAKTIFEEHTHLSEGVSDCSYGIQHHYLNTIMTLGERLKGEPL